MTGPRAGHGGHAWANAEQVRLLREALAIPSGRPIHPFVLTLPPEATMTDFSEVQWQSIERLDLLAGVVDGLYEETRAFLATLSQARPGVLDASTLDRAERQYREQGTWLDMYAEQFRRWRALPLTPPQRETVDRLSREVEATRPVVGQVLALVGELRSGSTNPKRERSAAEQALAELIGVPTRDDF